jgi:hypothetical protein
VAPVRAPRGAGRFPFLIRLHFPQGDFGGVWASASAEWALRGQWPSPDVVHDLSERSA